MVQLVFMRLPQFSDDLRATAIKQLKMKPGAMDQTRTKRKSRQSYRKKGILIIYFWFHWKYSNFALDIEDMQSPVLSKPQQTLRAGPLSTTPMTPGSNIVDMQGSISQNTPQNGTSDNGDINSPCSFPSTNQNDVQTECNVEINVENSSPTKDGCEEKSESLESTPQVKKKYVKEVYFVSFIFCSPLTQRLICRLNRKQKLATKLIQTA